MQLTPDIFYLQENKNLCNRLSPPLVLPKAKLAKTRNGVIFVLVICITAVERNALLKIATAGAAEKKDIFTKHADRHQNL